MTVATAEMQHIMECLAHAAKAGGRGQPSSHTRVVRQEETADGQHQALGWYLGHHASAE